MAVTVGSARSSFGNTKAGDQSGGKEVSTQEWYLHSKGWVLLRCKDSNFITSKEWGIMQCTP